jgi:hypothetical protein
VIDSMKRLGAVMVITFAITGCDPIVGGACAPGAILCDGQCVDPLSDESSCGGCGIRCASDEMCVSGSCTIGSADAGVGDGGGSDGGSNDGGASDGGSNDGGASDGGASDGGGSDGGSSDGGDGGSSDGGSSDGGSSDGGGVDGGGPVGPCDLGAVLCENACVSLAQDPLHCGACGNACGATELCQSGRCVLSCEAPLVACGGACIDLSNTPEHCGACGNVCSTGLCNEGVCERALAGHLVVLGHDFVNSRNAMERLLANSVLLSPAATVRVLSYEGHASAASIAGVEAALARRVGARMTLTTATSPDLVSGELAHADVFLVHAQSGGTLEELEALGLQWSRAMETFLLRGGVVVVLDTLAPHGGTWQLLEAAGRMRADGIEDATLATARILSPTDAVAIGVPLSYRAEATSVRFVGCDLPGVVGDGALPIVLHGTLTEMER